MGVQREHSETSKCPRKETRQTFRVRVRKTRDAHVLQVNAMFFRERRFDASDLLQRGHPITRNDIDVVEIVRGTRKIVIERSDESTKTVDVDRPVELAVDASQERAPRIA